MIYRTSQFSQQIPNHKSSEASRPGFGTPTRFRTVGRISVAGGIVNWASIWLMVAAIGAFGLLPTSADSPQRVCIILIGLGGMPEYEENFLGWGNELKKLFEAQPDFEVHFVDGRRERREDVLDLFRRVTSRLSESGEIWTFLIGHGNYDGSQFKFNIRGPDITDTDLREFLDGISGRRQYVIAGTSASGALLNSLSSEGRVVVTATRNEMQRQPPMFLSFFVEAATLAEADLNKDGRVSLLEAFLFSRRGVELWFQERGRIQTEHAVLDDRGIVRLESDGSSAQSATLALQASAAYLSSPPERAYRNLEAQGLGRERTGVEREIEDLKFRKSQLPETEYFKQLESLLIKLAELDEKIRRLENEP